MSRKTLYEDDSIISLPGREHVRLRTGQYLGSNLYTTQLLTEIFDNSLDEHTIGHGDKIEVYISGSEVRVRDYGQGILADVWREEDGLTVLEAACSVLNTSGKFDDSEEAIYTTSKGLHGIGMKLANFLSTSFEVSTINDGKKEYLKFKDGLLEKRKITKTKEPSGVDVKWSSDPQFFQNNFIDEETFKNYLKEITALCPNLTVIYNSGGVETIYKAEKGIETLLDKKVQGKEMLSNRFVLSREDGLESIDIAISYTTDYNEDMTAYVNYGITESGSHIQLLKTAFTQTINKYAEEEGFKTVLGGDLNEGLVIIFNLKTLNVKYDSQTKVRVVDFNNKQLINDAIRGDFYSWLKNNPKDAKLILDKANLANQARQAAKKAREGVRKATNRGKKFINLPTKLVDAYSKNRLECEIHVCEGDSAANGLIATRNGKTQAIFPVRGKVLSCRKATQDKIYANQEINNIIQALGLDIDRSTGKLIYNKKKLRYGKIFIDCDADPDGSNIRMLLINMFWELCPELILNGHLYTGVPPLFRITDKKNNYIYFKNQDELDKYKAKHKNEKFIINRMKGLGEMNPSELKDALLNPKTRNVIQLTVKDFNTTDNLLEIMMGPKVDPRKDYLLKGGEEYKAPIDRQLNEDFLEYAEEANQRRAFAHLRDGLKPVQRYILWAMYEAGHNSNKPHVKSAKIVGKVIGDYHAHGDSGTYAALVRMSQNWLNNISEIDFHGSNGSLIGGPQAASMRYTEARLSKVVEDGFLKNIKIADYQMNYSDDLKEPITFPAIFPRLFINGGSGIGYTISNDWQPGNLNEFASKVKEYIKTKKVTYNNIFPDYPTGGIIINGKQMKSIYKTGKGSVTLRGKVEISKNTIKVVELPYQVYAESFIQKVKDLSNEGKLDVDDIMNKSDEHGLNIEIKCGDVADTLQRLYKFTDLQVKLKVNQMAIINELPELITLEKYIKEYYKYNIEDIQKEFKYELNKVLDRSEIISGLICGINNIDKIVPIIKNSQSSDEARMILQSKYNLTEKQSKAIIDMRLSRLANLEANELLNEQQELAKKEQEYNKILNSQKEQDKIFISRLDEFVKKFGWERRTEIADIDFKVETKKNIVKEITSYAIELTENALRKIKLPEFRTDQNYQHLVLEANNRVILISNLGNVFRVPLHKIKICNMKAQGTLLRDIIELEDNEQIVIMTNLEQTGEKLVTITKEGYISILDADEYIRGINRSKFSYITIKPNDYIIKQELTKDSAIEINKVKINLKDYQEVKRNSVGRKINKKIYLQIKKNMI